MPKKVTVNSPRNSNPRQAGLLTSLAGFHSIPFSFTRRSSGALADSCSYPYIFRSWCAYAVLHSAQAGGH